MPSILIVGASPRHRARPCRIVRRRRLGRHRDGALGRGRRRTRRGRGRDRAAIADTGRRSIARRARGNSRRTARRDRRQCRARRDGAQPRGHRHSRNGPRSWRSTRSARCSRRARWHPNCATAGRIRGAVVDDGVDRRQQDGRGVHLPHVEGSAQRRTDEPELRAARRATSPSRRCIRAGSRPTWAARGQRSMWSESVAGLREVIAGLKGSGPARFLDYQGKTLPW